MKAIITKYHPATKTKGSRISARAEGNPVLYIPYPHELTAGAPAHAAAAVELCKRLDWQGTLVSGGLPNGDYCFCFSLSELFTIV